MCHVLNGTCFRGRGISDGGQALSAGLQRKCWVGCFPDILPAGLRGEIPVDGAASVHTGIGGMEMVRFRPMIHSSV